MMTGATVGVCDVADAGVRVRGGRRKVLVADDNTDAAESLATLLELMGNDVRTAADGVKAVEVAEEFRPDVAVLDIGMPRLDGHGVARRIRAAAWGKQVALIALTGWGQAEDRRRTAEAGFDLHLTKPVDPTTLDAMLTELCRGK
ncbi:MAG: response regulator [Gemmataceae bacterium]